MFCLLSLAGPTSQRMIFLRTFKCKCHVFRTMCRAGTPTVSFCFAGNHLWTTLGSNYHHCKLYLLLKLFILCGCYSLQAFCSVVFRLAQVLLASSRPVVFCRSVAEEEKVEPSAEIPHALQSAPAPLASGQKCGYATVHCRPLSSSIITCFLSFLMYVSLSL